MAFTNTPQQSTYRTHRFEIIRSPTGRNGTVTDKDQRLVNVFPERIKESVDDDKRYFVRQRPGTVHKLFLNPSTFFSTESRGCAYFNGALWSVVGPRLYKDGVWKGAISTSTGRVRFTQYNGTYDALILADTNFTYVIKTDDTLTQTTDADFPYGIIPFPVFIDGYLFVAKAGTGDIYNCVLDDPLSWTSGSFITAELYPDKIVALTKINNYLVAIGEKTTEFFYDAGIASGSPLQRNDTAVQLIGTPAPDSVATSEGEFLMVAQSDTGGRSVWQVKGFEAKDIGIPVLRQHLDSEGANISTASAFMVKTGGHKFYVLTTTTRTWAYDMEEKLWHEWTTTDTETPFMYKIGCDHPDGSFRLMHPTNGHIFGFSDSSTGDATDDTNIIPVVADIITEKVDFGSNNRKQCHRLSVVGDLPDATETLQVSWSDDDYKTWTPVRAMTLADFPSINQLGTFRRRAFRFTYVGDTPLRLQAYELDVNIGGS